MTVLFGHPSGNPNSHHAALAHFEAGRLEAFCVPWMPSQFSIRLLGHFGVLRPLAQRLSRRRFPPLDVAPKIQGRIGELRRLIMRAMGRGDERLSYQANDWLMQTMRRECRRAKVSAIHSYEDCSLWQFAEARRRGKACIYDMPIGYYPAWEQTQAELTRRYTAWLPAGGLQSSQFARPAQKRQEMDLADLVLVPSSFAAMTVRAFHPHKKLAQAFYGVDLDFWNAPAKKRERQTLRFIYAGQASLRKGTPLLLDAWERAALGDAELELVGSWQLAETKRLSLSKNVVWRPPCSPNELRQRYLAADVFVFPSFFEGFGLVLLEAMACGLPAIASDASAGPDIMTKNCGRLMPCGNVDALIENLRWFDKNREQLPAMSRAARSQAERFTWANYRRSVSEAVAPFV